MRLGVLALGLIVFPVMVHGQFADLENAFPLFDVMDIARVKKPLEHPVSFSEADFESKPWMKEFEWVIVVNKATQGEDRQSLRIYRDQRLVTASEIVAGLADSGGKNLSWHLRDLEKRQWGEGVFKVSTGREEFERKGSHGAQRDNYTITPSGYFIPQYFTRKHKSEAYSNQNCGGQPRYIYAERIEGPAHARRRVRYVAQVQYPKKCVYMEDVVFFNGGIALHRAISGTESALGTKASGGCVRLPGAVAMYLYDKLNEARPPMDLPRVNQDGTLALDENGQVIRASRNKSVWGELNARSVLIIVHDTLKATRPVPRPAM